MSTVFGQETPGSASSEFNTLSFVIWQILAQVQTITLVKVISCTNNGGTSPVGFVTVQPLVNQMTGNRQAVPHGQISGIPYLRLQGGANAVIIDPQPGDIGMCAFCSRDIAAVKASKGPANPGSFAMFDWADGLYLGGMLNGVPQQYVQFDAGGITVKSPTQITIDAPTVNIGLNGTVNIGNGNTTIDGKPMLTHKHTGVQVGGNDTGGVA